MTRLGVAPGVLLVSALGLGPSGVCSAQSSKTRFAPEATFNLFTPKADIEIGKASADETERQLPMYLDDAFVGYVNKLLDRLAKVAPGPEYPYRAHVVDAAEVNAFSLPGGPIFVTRGILAVAETEPELAAVLAHEMAHIVLRHGTNNASRVYLGKSGFGILGGLRGDRSPDPKQMINEIGGIGLNLAFVQFLDDEEYDADAFGARLLARAGYDPNVIVTFLGRIREKQRTDSVTYKRFLADHPTGKDRDVNLRASMTGMSFKAEPEIGGYQQLRAKLPIAPPNPTGVKRPWPIEAKDSVRVQSDPVVVTIPTPSARMLSFNHRTGFFAIDRPADWQVHDSMPGFGVVFAPIGGLVELPNGAKTIVHGIIVNHYAPFDGKQERAKRSKKQHFAPMDGADKGGPRGVLEDATDDLVRVLLWTNPYLAAPVGSAAKLVIDGERGYSTLLTGLSPLTGEEERVRVYTRALPDDHVVFMLCVAPARDFELLEPTFERMIHSLNVNEETVHKATPSFLSPGR